MAYYKLDYDEFFDPKYSNLNNGEGIGATGIITSNQSIHVFNDYDIDPKSQIEYIGLGKHDSKKSEILQDIYGIESSVKDVYLYKVISLSYMNSAFGNNIVMFLPRLITKEEFNYLKDLKEYYDYVIKKYGLTIGAITFGNNIRDCGPETEYRNKYDPILEFAHERVDENLKREEKEKILKI